MRESHRWSSSLVEGCSHKILLANYEGRLHKVCTAVQAVPTTWWLAQGAPEELRSIYSPWSFHIWGIDILGPFPLAMRQMKYLVVAIEYFTKWIEVELVAQITTHKVQHFVWKNIVCRFGVPKWLVSDNGTQFASQQLGKLYTELEIKLVFTSVMLPRLLVGLGFLGECPCVAIHVPCNLSLETLTLMGLSTSKEHWFVSYPNVPYTPYAWSSRGLGLFWYMGVNSCCLWDPAYVAHYCYQSTDVRCPMSFSQADDRGLACTATNSFTYIATIISQSWHLVGCFQNRK